MHVARGCQPRDASVELPILSQFRREEQLYRWRPRPDLRPLAGIPMVALCEEFGISRKTGHKIYQRYRQIGVQGLMIIAAVTLSIDRKLMRIVK